MLADTENPKAEASPPLKPDRALTANLFSQKVKTPLAGRNDQGEERNGNESRGIKADRFPHARH
jgi:hypothetical protein